MLARRPRRGAGLPALDSSAASLGPQRLLVQHFNDGNSLISIFGAIFLVHSRGSKDVNQCLHMLFTVRLSEIYQ